MKISEFPTPKRKLSALKSIKFYCKELCCAGDLKSWKYCTATKCTLYDYRLGLGNRTQKKKHIEKHLSIQQNSKINSNRKAIQEETSNEIQKTI